MHTHQNTFAHTEKCADYLSITHACTYIKLISSVFRRRLANSRAAISKPIACFIDSIGFIAKLHNENKIIQNNKH